MPESKFPKWKKANGLEVKQEDAIRMVKDRGLYLFCEGTRRDPIWRIYCSTSGACLGYYLPKRDKGAFGLNGDISSMTFKEAMAAAINRKEKMGIS